jgi:flagellar L-ring protein precursor FlgH
MMNFDEKIVMSNSLYDATACAPWRLCMSQSKSLAIVIAVLAVGAARFACGQDASLVLAAPVNPQNGGLVQANCDFMYRRLPPEAEQRELQINDIVTVLVDYRSSMLSEGDAKSKRNNNFNAVLSDWLKFDGKNISPAPFNNGDPRIKGQLDSQFKTEADLSSKDALTFRIAANVVDIRPNGNLVLEARNEVQHDDEVWEQSITGVVRRQSIGPDRTVRSDAIAESRIRFRKKGFVHDGIERGWFTKWYDCWKPF